jgi:DNA-binding transcriptional LysR family regulator
MLDRAVLEVFLAVADHRNFVAAADSLGIAQSVVSKRLARLEDALGTRLFDRGSRTPIRLTRTGELFLGEARTALGAMEQAERIGRALAHGDSGPLRLGYVFSGAMTGMLTSLVTALAATLPNVQLLPSLMDTPAQLRALADGRIDVAIVRPRLSWPERTHVLGEHREPMIIALGDAMALASQDGIRLPDLVGQTFLTPQFHEEVGLAQMVRDLARTGGLPEPAIRATGDFITAASLAAAGQGVILAPASLARLRLAGLTFRPILDYAAQLVLVVVARADLPQVQADIIAKALHNPPQGM